MKSSFIRCKLKSENGFIFAEVILSIFVISVAIVAICGMFIQAVLASTMAKHCTEATNLAQKQLELLKINPPEYWASITLPRTIPWQDNTQIPSYPYDIRTKASVYPMDDHLVEITVTVCWQERTTECKIQFVALYPIL